MKIEIKEKRFDCELPLLQKPNQNKFNSFLKSFNSAIHNNGVKFSTIDYELDNFSQISKIRQPLKKISFNMKKSPDKKDSSTSMSIPVKHSNLLVINDKTINDRESAKKVTKTNFKKIKKENLHKTEVFFKLTDNLKIKTLTDCQQAITDREYNNYLKSFYKEKRKNEPNSFRSLDVNILSKGNSLMSENLPISKSVLGSNESLTNRRKKGNPSMINDSLLRSKEKLFGENMHSNDHATSHSPLVQKKSLTKLENTNEIQSYNNKMSSNKNLRAPDFSKQLYRYNINRDNKLANKGQFTYDTHYIYLEHQMNKNLLNSYEDIVYTRLKFKEDSNKHFMKFDKKLKQFRRDIKSTGLLKLRKDS